MTPTPTRRDVLHATTTTPLLFGGIWPFGDELDDDAQARDEFNESLSDWQGGRIMGFLG